MPKKTVHETCTSRPTQETCMSVMSFCTKLYQRVASWQVSICPVRHFYCKMHRKKWIVEKRKRAFFETQTTTPATSVTYLLWSDFSSTSFLHLALSDYNTALFHARDVCTKTCMSLYQNLSQKAGRNSCKFTVQASRARVRGMTDINSRQRPR